MLFLDEDAASTVSNVATSAMATAATVLLLSLYWVNRRTPFRDIGIGLTAFMMLATGGWVSWAVQSEVIGEVPSPSVSDVFWLSAYFMFILLMYSQVRRAKVKLGRSALASSTLYWIVMLLVLVLAINPTVGSEDLTTAEQVVYSLYPVVDVLMLYFLLLLVWQHHLDQLEDLWMFLSTAAAFWMIGDFLYLGAQASGAYSEGSLPDFFYLCTYGLLDVGYGVLVARRITYTSIVPAAEVAEPKELTDPMKPRATYIVWDQTPDRAYRMFMSNLGTGLEGLILSRKPPAAVREAHKLEHTPVFWLSTVAGSDSVYPGNLGILTDMMTRFFEKGPNTIVMFEGFESVVVYSEFKKALLMLDQLKDIVTAHKSRLVVPIDPRTLNERERSLVSKNAVVLDLTAGNGGSRLHSGSAR